ncbi:MAG: hypothetical protein K0R55_2992, partial [Sporomusa sp.]|nr:hypothetical protein [Sporomusa sp.]
MKEVVLSLADWSYMIFLVITFICLATKRDALLPTLAGLFVTGIALKGTLIGGFIVTYKAILTAGTDLLNIVVIIAAVIMLTKIMEDMGTDQIMIMPVKKLLRGPMTSFWVLAVVTLLLSWVIRATPTAALIGALLVPAAVAAGLAPMVAAMVLSIVAKGIGLSSDFVTQATPAVTSKITKIPAGEILAASIPIWATVSIVAIICAFIMTRKMQEEDKVKREAGDVKHLEFFKNTIDAGKNIVASTFGKIMAVVIPSIFVFDIYAMIHWNLSANDAMGLIGGTCYIISLFCIMVHYRDNAFDKSLEYARSGWIFAVKVFGPVIVIGGFFWLGGDSLKEIMGNKQISGLAYNWGYFIAEHMPINTFMVAVLTTVASAFAAFDGSGFAAIPLGASIAMALGKPIGANVAYL